MTYRNDMEALAARKDRLAAEVESKTRELDATSRMLDEMKAKARLPVLPNIRVASPCTADWAGMAPVGHEGDRVRHCGSCDKNVYNLSSMTRDEAEALILAKEGRLCVRYFQRKDGTILLKDCTVGTANARKRRLIAAGAAALLASGGAAMMTTHRTHDAAASIDTRTVEDVRGEVEVAHSADDPPPPAPLIVDEPEPLHELKGKIAIDHDEIQGGLEMPADDDLQEVLGRK